MSGVGTDLKCLKCGGMLFAMATEIRKSDARLDVRYYRCSGCGNLTVDSWQALSNVSEILRILGFSREQREHLEQDIKKHLLSERVR